MAERTGVVARRTVARVARFFVLGAALWFAERAYTRATEPRPTLEVVVRPGSSPSEREARVREAVLVEEGLALGWARTDAVIRARLAANLRFTRGEAVAQQGSTARAEEDALVDAALALGMARTDVVVRRRLVERAERLLEGGARRAPVSDAQLLSFRDAHAEAFRAPGRVRFTEVFVARQAHPSDFESAVGAMRARVVEADLAPAAARALSEPLLVSVGTRWVSADELERRYGPGFGAAALASPVGRWAGPHRSTYGAHFVFVHERSEGRLLGVAEARTRLLGAYHDAQARQVLARHVEALRGRYDLRFVEGDVPDPSVEAGP